MNEDCTLIMLVGLPRSGKSTWVDNNKDLGVVISTDWIREEILGTHYANNANAIIWMIADATLRIVLGQGKTAILDAVNHTKAVRSFYIKLARQYGAKIHMVLLDTSLDLCIKRNDDQKLPEHILRQMHEQFEKPELLEYDTIQIVRI